MQLVSVFNYGETCGVMDGAVVSGAIYRAFYSSVVSPFYDGLVGRTLIVVGLVLVGLGVLIVLGERLPIKLGRLPGDIVIRGKNSVFYFPIVTSLLLSAILSLVMWLLNRR
jgi:hypothetical protein